MRHRHKRTSRRLQSVATLSKGKIGRRIIGRLIEGEYEYTLHATKGYRRTRK